MAKPPSKQRREFAKRLAAARVLAGFEDAKKFAEDALRIQAQRYRRWERAEAEPDLEHLIKISDITGVSLDMLIRGVERDAGAREGPLRKIA